MTNRIKVTDPAFLKAVDRLEKEKNELEERWEREGKADGREWALQASYEDLDIVTDAAHDALELPAVVEDIIREEVALKEEPALYRGESSARMFWLFGWLDGVMEAWMEIHDEMSRRRCAREEGTAPGGAREACKLGDICFNECDRCPA